MLLGECYINTEDYSAAMEAYAKAIDYDSENASAYGNYAVALARVGKIDQAEEELESAISSGLDKASIYYTYGELNYAGEEWKEADAYFEKCLEHTNDSYMRERAVLMRLNILDQMSVTKENCEKKLEIISQAIEQYGNEMEQVLLQELVQVYSDLAMITGNESYTESAIEILENIIDGGMAIYADYQNLVMLYLNTQALADAEKCINRMLDLYGDDYRTYMWYALLEAQKQMQLENTERDYQPFNDYYKEAMKLYQKQTESNQNNVYMVKLEKIHQDVVKKKWVEGEKDER